MKFACALVIFAVFAFTANASVLDTLKAKLMPEPKAEGDEWWRHANFYQVYPRSFMDANNDGSGDIQGITQKLEYLTLIGVENVWLSPVFDSPMVDAGYDISDFTKINPLFGTMKDFEDMLEAAHILGMRIVLDFVPNHSSDQHIWFYKSMHRVEGYEDYYIWENATLNATGGREPPNNWLSVFSNSAWTWNELREQYYFHQFAEQQPDLNYRNPAVVEEMKNVIRFWLDKGVDGFRIDAIPHLFETESLEDEPKNPDSTGVEGVDWDTLIHIHTKDLNETYDMVYQWREVTDEFVDPPRVLMTEAYTSIENTMRYYGEGERLGVSFSFNFFLLTELRATSTADDFERAINLWIDAIDPAHTSNWVMGNHDNHRVASRHGAGRVDGINMLVNILPGVGVTYNGEEIGMENGFVSWEETEDPSGINAGECCYLDVTRDLERTPFHWDSTDNAGFNNGTPTWLPVSDKYVDTNVALQEEAEKSHLSVFKEIMMLRKEQSIIDGSLVVAAANADVLVVARELLDNSPYVLIFNVNNGTHDINLKEVLPDTTLEATLVVSISSVDSTYKRGDEISSTEVFSIGPYEAIVVGNTLATGKGSAYSINISIMSLLVSIFSYLLFNY